MHAGPDDAGIPIACDLTVFTPAERAEHLAQSQRVFTAIECLTEEADGFVLTLSSTPSRRTEVEHWIATEQRCCPFFRFDLWEEDNGETLAVSVSGPGAAKDILRAGIEQYSVASKGTQARKGR